MKRAALDYFPRCVRVRSLLFCLSSFTNERANVRMCVYLCIRRCELSAATAAFTSPTCVCVCVYCTRVGASRSARGASVSRRSILD